MERRGRDAATSAPLSRPIAQKIALGRAAVSRFCDRKRPGHFPAQRERQTALKAVCAKPCARKLACVAAVPMVHLAQRFSFWRSCSHPNDLPLSHSSLLLLSHLLLLHSTTQLSTPKFLAPGGGAPAHYMGGGISKEEPKLDLAAVQKGAVDLTKSIGGDYSLHFTKLQVSLFSCHA